MIPKPSTPRQVVADFRAAALSSGRYDLMVNEYCYPLTIYLDGVPTVVQGPSDVWAFYQSFHSAMLAEGFDRLTARVTAEDLPRSGRFRVWTEWSAQGPKKMQTIIASTICYCTQLTSGEATEMLEFTKLALSVMAI